VKERLPLLACALLLACSSSRVGYDVHPDAPIALYRSFGILEAAPREPVPEDPRFGPLLDRHTEDAIDLALRTRGYELRQNGAVDFLVSYANEVRFEHRHESSPVSVGVGYGAGIGSGVGIGTGWYGPTDVRSRSVARGTLVIDVLEPQTRRVVWRGWAKDTLSRDGDPRAEIFAAVNEILAQFPATAPR
jgi:hypothetical protein